MDVPSLQSVLAFTFLSFRIPGITVPTVLFSKINRNDREHLRDPGLVLRPA